MSRGKPMLGLAIETILPHLHCPNCAVGLEVFDYDIEDKGWTEEEGHCPECDVHLVIDRSVTTHYYPMVKANA
jgi:DNA polymerase III alpha subunit (gram-positive type)